MQNTKVEPTEISEATAATARCVRADARKNDEKLVAAARTAFLANGTKASLEDIARQAGVGIGTLYRHFPTRQHLVEAVVQDSLEQAYKAGHELLASPDPRAALFSWMQMVIEQAAAFRGLASSLAVALCSAESEKHGSCTEMRNISASLLQRCQEAGDIRGDVTVDDLLMMLNAMAWTTEQTTAASFNTLLSVMLDGLSVRS